MLENRYGAEALRELDLFIDRAGIELVEVDVDQARVARRAYSRFGKGRHPAGLDYGDCFTYALARVYGQTLLAKDEGFDQTDIARYPDGEEDPAPADKGEGPPL